MNSLFTSINQSPQGLDVPSVGSVASRAEISCEQGKDLPS